MTVNTIVIHVCTYSHIYCINHYLSHLLLKEIVYSSISEWTFEFENEETLWDLRDRIGEEKLTDEGDYHGFRFFYHEGIEIEDPDNTKLREIFNFTELDNVVQVDFLPHESAAEVTITSDRNVEILHAKELMKLKANEEKSVNFEQAKFMVSIMF